MQIFCQIFVVFYSSLKFDTQGVKNDTLQSEQILNVVR